MPQMPSSLTDADIFARVVRPESGNFSQEISRLVLTLKFEAEDIGRMNELAEKNNRGVLSETERQEMETYLRVGNFLNLLHAKARQSLHNLSN
jgi:uncharacterized protein YnzC (UPF0291/DUF896 family)